MLEIGSIEQLIRMVFAFILLALMVRCAVGQVVESRSLNGSWYARLIPVRRTMESRTSEKRNASVKRR
jgi:hypothetical protein